MDKIIDIFKKLQNSKSEEEIEDICFEIRSFLQRNSTLLIQPELIPYITMGLDKSSHHEVNYTTLYQINILVQEKGPEAFEYLTQTTKLLYKILDLLSSDNLKCAVIVISLIKKLLLLPTLGDRLILSDEFSENFSKFYKEYGRDSTEIEFRIFEIAAIILSKDNKLLLEKYQPFLEMISKTFINSQDYLVQMNIIEIISTICLQNKGLLLVQNIGIFDNFNLRLNQTIELSKIIKTQKELDADRSISLPLLNKIINFVGSVSSISNENTEILFKYDFMKVFSYHLENDENVLSKHLLSSIVTAIGNVGVNNKGLDLILRDEGIMKHYMELILSNDPSTTTSSMISFSIMLHNKDPMNIISDKLYQIYQTIPSELLSQRLLKNLTSPQEEIKKANFSLLTSLCIHSWGVEDVMKIPGFYEYLIGHFNETNKIYREWKFKIIQNIVDNHQDLFKSSPERLSQFRQLTTYLRRGPHYVETESRVDYAVL